MSINNTLPSTIIQMGHVEKIVEVQQNQPHMQQLAAQDEAAAQLLREKGRIEGTEKSQSGKKIREKNEEDERKRKREEQQRRAAGNAQEDETGLLTDEERKTENPWAGNILNVKI